MKRAFVFVVVALATFAFSGIPLASGQAASELPPTGKIPEHFKTYSLFLVCNPQWLAPDKTEGLHLLYQQFQNFGRTIGDDNLAVWFLRSAAERSDHGLAQNIDVERSTRFCQAWKLKPSVGPHLVVTSTYPDESHLSSGLPSNSAVFELGNMSPKQISDLLAKLTDELIENGRVDNSTPAPEAPPGLWVRLLEATQRTINSFGCAWSFKIAAGPLNADLHSCQSQ